MSRRNMYAPDYHKLYPGVVIPPNIMRVLTTSDRKMKYCEFDLKTERKRENRRTKTVIITPAREDSLDRLVEDNDKQYALENPSPEDKIVEQDELERLRYALKRLEPEERELVRALFFENTTERQYAERLGISQKAVNKRWHKVRLKIKKLIGG